MTGSAPGPMLPAGFGLAAFDEIDSTMDEARRRAQAGEAGPLWIWARRQSAGRGRRGRAWRSGEGNLLCTLLLRPDCEPGEGARLSFLTAVALGEALESFAGPGLLSFKWPNDVLLRGRKVSGILLESESGPDNQLAWLSIGIGVNLAEHPTDSEFPATSFPAEGFAAPEPGAALERLAASMAAWLTRWREGGFAPVREAWLARAARLGEPIRVRLANETLDGTFSALDDQGCLVLTGAGGARRISAGDVFLPQTA